MVGLCGQIGDDLDMSGVIEKLRVTGDENITTFSAKGINISFVDHPRLHHEQPVILPDGTYLWCWGDLHGFKGQGGNYIVKDSNLDTIQFCKYLYIQNGLQFIKSLNGQFSGVHFRPDTGQIILFTDRLGTRPIFYQQGDGCFVFSSLLQSLAQHPNTDFQFDLSHLTEFVNFSRNFGIHTPIKDVKIIPPATIANIHSNDLTLDTKQYWWPVINYKENDFNYFVRTFSQIFDKVMNQRINNDLTNGLLLSGGNDSKLIAHYLPSESKAFHMNEALDGNREARAAEQIAEKCDLHFEFLERDLEYYGRVLDQIANVNNFNGRFYHAHSLGFMEKIRNDVDCLFTGQLSDTILGGLYIPGKYQKGILNYLLPKITPAPITTTQEFIEFIDRDGLSGKNNQLAFWNEEFNLEEQFNFNAKNNSLTFQGVKYPSLKSLFHFAPIFPITNVENYLFYESLLHSLPISYPFLDNRIIDLSLQMPVKHRWRDVVPYSIREKQPELNEIKHPQYYAKGTSNRYLKFYLSQLDRFSTKLQRKIKGDSVKHHLAGPWPDMNYLFRHAEFPKQKLDHNSEFLRASNLIDKEKVDQTYTEHINGKKLARPLSVLFTLFESYPINENITANSHGKNP